VIAIAFAALACEEKTALWIIPGSTANQLEFGVSHRRGGTKPIEFQILNVHTCPGASGQEVEYWVLVADSSAVPSARIRYGVPPPGYRSLMGPLSIDPGCYHAAIAGTGRLQFEVGADGRVLEQPFGGPSHDSLEATRHGVRG